VGRAIVHVLADAPISVHWIDEREWEFPENIPANVCVEITDTPQSCVQSAPPQSAVLITTHRHDLDFKLAALALSREDLRYCGLIGSRSKRVRFERLWRQRERDDLALARLTCPIGANGPVGKEPAVVAIAVAAEILQSFQM